MLRPTTCYEKANVLPKESTLNRECQMWSDYSHVQSTYGAFASNQIYNEIPVLGKIYQSSSNQDHIITERMQITLECRSRVSGIKVLGSRNKVAADLRLSYFNSLLA